MEFYYIRPLALIDGLQHSHLALSLNPLTLTFSSFRQLPWEQLKSDKACL